MNTNTALADFIWKNADDLWGNFKHVDFGKIILPFTLLRRWNAFWNRPAIRCARLSRT